jgi:2-deoxy-D-gluconate 3-dehydrogenase
MSALFDLTGKVAVVTGAGRGLGQGLAIGLAEAGADLALVVNQSAPDETAQTVEKLGRRAVVIRADLSHEAGASAVVKETLEAFGKVDILVNNAGIIRRAPAADHAYSDWQQVLDVNLNSVFLLCQSFGREMLKQGSGKIINIASMLSFQGGITVPGYTASKHAVTGLTKALANEWAGQGINVNAIAPGYMSTDNTEALRNDENRNRQILERIPAARWGTPDDMKGPVVFLASDAANYMSGHVLCVDGGWMTR